MLFLIAGGGGAGEAAGGEGAATEMLAAGGGIHPSHSVEGWSNSISTVISAGHAAGAPGSGAAESRTVEVRADREPEAPEEIGTTLGSWPTSWGLFSSSSVSNNGGNVVGRAVIWSNGTNWTLLPTAT